MKRSLAAVALLSSLLAAAPASQAVVISFDGGIAYRFSTPASAVTDNFSLWDDVDYYEEDGFRLDFIGNDGTQTFSALIGDFYGEGNAVIHGHWASGSFGDLTQIQVTKVGGGAFDLNYFILTSNTDFGGGPASGAELTYVSHDGGLDPILLPPEDWGFPATTVFLPASYDRISSFEFFTAGPVDSFGLDEFEVGAPAPPPIADTGSSLGLAFLGLAAVAGWRRRA